MLDFLFGEEDFQEKMNQEVLPLLDEQLKDDFFQSYDDTRIHYSCLIHPNERAAIVISHGFCEFIGKYHEIMYYFYHQGYSVFFIDHRGHGYSQRFVEEWDKVYIKDYQEYVDDLKCFMDQVVTKQSLTGKYILYAHSMGGAIGTMFLEQYPDYFKAAILSSPMLQMSLGDIPDWKVKLLFMWSTIAHWQYHYVPGQKGFDGVPVFEESSTLSKVRYDYMFHLREQVKQYQSYGGTYAWTKASLRANKQLQADACKVQIPVLLFQAGQDTMVRPEAQEAFVKDAADVKLVRFAESKHEIFNATTEIRMKYYEEIFAFLEKHL